MPVCSGNTTTTVSFVLGSLGGVIGLSMMTPVSSPPCWATGAGGVGPRMGIPLGLLGVVVGSTASKVTVVGCCCGFSEAGTVMIPSLLLVVVVVLSPSFPAGAALAAGFGLNGEGFVPFELTRSCSGKGTTTTNTGFIIIFESPSPVVLLLSPLALLSFESFELVSLPDGIGIETTSPVWPPPKSVLGTKLSSGRIFTSTGV